MWFSVDRQLWPSVWYGLCCSMATLPELESVLLSFYGKMLPLEGIVSKANRGIHQFDRGFYGADFPHPGVEATAEQANKLLMHYGCHTALKTELQSSLELLVVDLGLSFQPFRLTSKLQTIWGMGDYVLVKAGLGEGRLLRICPYSEQSLVILPSRGQRLADGKIYHHGLHRSRTFHFEPSTETPASSLLV
jgi:hypothetical protein